jgi:hypothetical protein
MRAAVRLTPPTWNLIVQQAKVSGRSVPEELEHHLERVLSEDRLSAIQADIYSHDRKIDIAMGELRAELGRLNEQIGKMASERELLMRVIDSLVPHSRSTHSDPVKPT